MTDNAAATNAIHDTAIAAVDAAVAVLTRSLGDTTTLSAHGRDIKTQADLDAESAMFEILRSTSSLPILSEEAGADSGFDATATGWVVDPLDGTANFARVESGREDEEMVAEGPPHGAGVSQNPASRDKAMQPGDHDYY